MKTLRVRQSTNSNKLDLTIFIRRFMTGNKNFHSSNHEISINTAQKKNEYDVVVLSDNFTSSIDPKLYGDANVRQSPIETTSDYSNSFFVKEAITNNKKIIAIGKAAHLVCLASGGTVIQSVSGHHKMYSDPEIGTILDKSFSHDVITFDSRILRQIPSCHEQMMYPFIMDRTKYSIIAYADMLSTSLINIGGGRSQTIPFYYNSHSELCPPCDRDYFFGDIPIKKESDITSNVEPEIVYFRNTNALCFEFDPNQILDSKENRPVIDYISKIIDLFIQNKL